MRFKNFWFRFLFYQADYLVKKARTETISAEDFPEIPSELDPSLAPQERRASIHFQGPAYKVLLSFLKVYKKSLLKAFAFLFVSMVASLSSPQILKHFIAGLSASDSVLQNLMLGLSLALCGVVVGTANQHYFYQSLGIFQKIGNDLSRRVFEKSLKLSLIARGKTQIGDLVNHMSSDVDTISDFPMILGDLLWTFVIVIAAMGMLFQLIGKSAIAPLVIMLALAPLTRWIARRFINYEKSMMQERDSRVTLISQILQSIRVVKYFAWEKAVAKEVQQIRDQELGSRKKLARAEVMSGVSYVAVSSLVLFVALWIHAWRGESLDAATIFTCLSLFGLLEEPFGQLSRLFSRWTQALVSTSRLIQFFSLEEVPLSLSDIKSEQNLALEIKAANIYYENPELPVLKDINLELKPGESLAIVGPVGSGKTSLLNSLLGELKISSGSVSINKSLSLAYVPQEAYVVNSTLLENLTFGNALTSKEELRAAVHMAALDKDIRVLPAGLRTEIGEKGVNLSGGQKQRLSLARACLQGPEFVLLDDPLSAVDYQTENHICEKLIFGHWKNLTRVMVTHRLESLPKFDRIVFLQEGKITASGSLSELLESCAEFTQFYSLYQKLEMAPKENQEEPNSESVASDSRITEDEERATGAVKSSVYKDYVLSLAGDGKRKNWILVALGLVAVTATLLPLIQKWWLSYYSGHPLILKPLLAVEVYGVIGVFVLIGNLCNQIFWLERGINSGKLMHEKMLRSILKAPIRFFDSTPVGRILQRFSRDIESVDIYLQWSFEAFVQCFLQVCVSLGLILIVIPPMLLMVLPVSWLYYRLQLDYRRPAREAKRLDSIARSPRYAHFKESLIGLPIIRAFRRETWFESEFLARLKNSQRMFYAHYMLNRWFSSRIPLLGGFISLGTAMAVVLLTQNHWINAGTAGLVMLYSLSFWAQLNWGIRIFADIESRMTSVERLKFYSSIPSEGFQSQIEVPAEWPSLAEIRINDLHARYAEHFPKVLSGINLHVKPGQRVGIIGRTGSGKSTLFQCLYRFVEAESGSIEIGGLDIREIPLERLRRTLAIVPQDPILFLGSLRSNLDRYSEFTDDEIFESLEKTGLKSFVQNLPQGLLTAVQENGSNLSQGQRQLLCLARALMMKAKFVLMDEATASVDVQTDQQIQKVIKETLSQTTILIIAHRLGTLKDCDQVIELSDGKVLKTFEASHPMELVSLRAHLDASQSVEDLLT